MKKFILTAACVLYVLSPVDLMPEILLGPFGLGDDLVAVLLGIRTALKR